jgi:hypothetical protein
MTDAAIISGSLVDVRNVGTHKSVKLTIHVPEEHAMRVVAAFGWPTGVNPVSVAIARMTEASAKQPLPSPTVSRIGAGEAERRKFETLLPAQQAGILCNEVAFHRFLQEKFYLSWMRCDDFNDQRRSANVIREICEVDSRADITRDNALWSALVLAYRLWQREPEFV